MIKSTRLIALGARLELLQHRRIRWDFRSPRRGAAIRALAKREALRGGRSSGPRGEQGGGRRMGRRPKRARGGACLPARLWRPTSTSTTASPEPRRETRCRHAAPCWSWPGPSSTAWRSTWAPCRAATGATGFPRLPPDAPWRGCPRCGWAPRKQRRGSGARCACWSSRRRRRRGRCPASTSSTPAASCPGSERPTPARSAATSCPPTTRTTRSTSRRRSGRNSRCTDWSISMAPCTRDPRGPSGFRGEEPPPPVNLLGASS